jgi:hypothetical protein
MCVTVECRKKKRRGGGCERRFWGFSTPNIKKVRQSKTVNGQDGGKGAYWDIRTGTGVGRSKKWYAPLYSLRKTSDVRSKDSKQKRTLNKTN